MREKTTVKILSQSFYPDFVATGELLFELAEKLVSDHNINVSVITAQPSFVKKERQPIKQTIKGIKIRRLEIFNFDKNSFIGKVLNSWSFFFHTMLYITMDKKVDWLLIPTSPPLLPLIGTYAKLFKKQKYVYLMHDVYPEIAARLGYIKQNGIIYKAWDFLSKISLKYADKIIVLSDNMKEGLIDWIQDIDQDRISVIHNWANEETIKVILKKENHFIEKYNLKGKFVIEYSGNIGRIHEFNTIIEAARELKDYKDIVFLFIGHGGQKPQIEALVDKYKLDNIMFLPYQDRQDLSYSLGMADIHVVSLMEGYRFFAAPSKLYGILASGKPVLFVGNQACYIADLLKKNKCGFHIHIGDYEGLKDKIIIFKNSKEICFEYGYNSRKLFERNFTLEKISNLYSKFIFDKEEKVIELDQSRIRLILENINNTFALISKNFRQSDKKTIIQDRDYEHTRVNKG
ncbi:MAG: hypothetical protein A2287_00795 [Candidatus Melainabacteria bacterium RIFOXYA12_FULL_32_12]|nr:MAG: hypothetical protein A2287_00795 [Candidatus Melainabacteria bacterium RIFOXYA12_FULL_32_12]